MNCQASGNGRVELTWGEGGEGGEGEGDNSQVK